MLIIARLNIVRCSDNDQSLHKSFSVDINNDEIHE